MGREQRTGQYTDHEGRTDGDAGDCIGLGAHGGPGRVGQRSKRHRAHGSRPLDDAGEDELKNIFRESAGDASQRENSETDYQDRSAPPTVAGPAERDLCQTLGKWVDAKGDTGQRDARPRVLNRVDAEDRQYKKDAKQAQRRYQTDGNDGSSFRARKGMFFVRQDVGCAPLVPGFDE